MHERFSPDLRASVAHFNISQYHHELRSWLPTFSSSGALILVSEAVLQSTENTSAYFARIVISTFEP